jgi:hypothetical protein
VFPNGNDSSLNQTEESIPSISNCQSHAGDQMIQARFTGSEYLDSTRLGSVYAIAAIQVQRCQSNNKRSLDCILISCIAVQRLAIRLILA